MRRARSRLTWYLVVSVVIAAAMGLANVTGPILVGYPVIAVFGFALAVRNARAARAQFVADVEAAEERIAQRIRDSEAATRSLPWYQDVAAAQVRDRTRRVSVRVVQLIQSDWSFDQDALVRQGLTIPDQIEVVEAMIRDGPPADWLKGFIITELRAGGDSYHQALVRVGLYWANEHRFTAE